MALGFRGCRVIRLKALRGRPRREKRIRMRREVVAGITKPLDVEVSVRRGRCDAPDAKGVRRGKWHDDQ